MQLSDVNAGFLFKHNIQLYIRFLLLAQRFDLSASFGFSVLFWF